MQIESSNPQASSGWNIRDVVLVGGLVLAAIALRLPTLNENTLDCDECQYMANGYYAALSSESTFANVDGPIQVYAAFAQLAKWFGPYRMFPMRVVTIGITIVVATLLYGMTKPVVGRGLAFASSLVFLHLNIYFWGLTANMEWFCNLGFVLAVSGLLRAGKSAAFSRGWLVFSGFCGAATLMAKIQPAFMLPTIPMAILLLPKPFARLREKVIAVGWVILGCSLAGAIYVGPFLLANSLRGHIQSMLDIQVSYAFDSSGLNASFKNATFPQRMVLYFDKFYREPEFWPFFALGYCGGLWALLTTAMACLRDRRKVRESCNDSFDPRWAALAIYLLFCMIAVRAGHRFFAHYYLLMMPAIASLGGYAAFLLSKEPASTIRSRIAWLAATTILAVELFPLVQQAPPQFRSLVFLAAGGAAALVAASLLQTESPNGPLRPTRFVQMTYWLFVAKLVVCVQLIVWTGERAWLGHPRMTGVATRIRNDSRIGDRIFVWGWRPELYVLTGLPPASRFVISSYIVNDTRGNAEGIKEDAGYMKKLMTDLEASSPRFFVDAGPISETMSNRSVFALNRYPTIERYLEQKYRKDFAADGCTVYVRKE